MDKSRFSILFIMQKGKPNAECNAPIFARITINHQMTHLATRYYLPPEHWLPKEGRTGGHTKEEKEVNAHLDNLRGLIFAKYNEMFLAGEVVPVTKGNETIGYTMTFSSSDPITIYHGTNGEDGHTPIIGVKQAADGIYYWTVDGEWLLDENGSRVRVYRNDDIVPQLKIEELLLELQKEVTILIVTHNMGQAKRISSKSMFMYLGELVEYGDTETMFTNPSDERTKAYLTGKMG